MAKKRKVSWIFDGNQANICFKILWIMMVGISLVEFSVGVDILGFPLVTLRCLFGYGPFSSLASSFSVQIPHNSPKNHKVKVPNKNLIQKYPFDSILIDCQTEGRLTNPQFFIQFFWFLITENFIEKNKRNKQVRDVWIRKLSRCLRDRFNKLDSDDICLMIIWLKFERICSTVCLGHLMGLNWLFVYRRDFGQKINYKS